MAPYIKKFSPSVKQKRRTPKITREQFENFWENTIYENAVRDKWKPRSLSISMPFSSTIQTAPASDQLLAILRSVVEVFAFLCCYTAFTDVSWWPVCSSFKRTAAKEDCLTTEDGTDRLSRNVCKQLPTKAAWQPKRAKTSEQVTLLSHGSEGLKWINSFPKLAGQWLATAT